MSISIVIPVFNEEESIKDCLSQTGKAFETTDYEIIAVNDGSTDQSEKIIRQAAKKNPKIKVVSYPSNQGYGFAVRTGIEKAKKEFISYLDADLQYSPFELKKMLDFCQRQNAVFVLGKPERKYSSLMRKTVSLAYNKLVFLFLRIPVQDANSLKVIQTKTAQSLRLENDRWMIDLEIVTKIFRKKIPVVFFPVHVKPRTKGKSKLKFRPKLVFETLQMIWRLQKNRKSDN